MLYVYICVGAWLDCYLYLFCSGILMIAVYFILILYQSYKYFNNLLSFILFIYHIANNILSSCPFAICIFIPLNPSTGAFGSPVQCWRKQTWSLWLKLYSILQNHCIYCLDFILLFTRQCYFRLATILTKYYDLSAMNLKLDF